AATFEDYLANRAVDQSEVDKRAGRLAELTDAILPALDRRQDRLIDAIESGILTKDQAQKRSTQLREECEAAEAERDELAAWVRDEAADRAQAQGLATRWAEGQGG